MRSIGPRRRRALPAAGLFLGLIASLLVVGCGRSSNATPSGPSLGVRALQSLTPFEKKALKDKTVSLAELMASTQVYEECLRAHHVDFDIGSPENLGPSGVQTVITVPANVASPDEVADKLTAQARACLAQVSAVEDVWVLQHQVSQADL